MQTAPQHSPHHFKNHVIEIITENRIFDPQNTHAQAALQNTTANNPGEFAKEINELRKLQRAFNNAKNDPAPKGYYYFKGHLTANGSLPTMQMTMTQTMRDNNHADLNKKSEIIGEAITSMREALTEQRCRASQRLASHIQAITSGDTALDRNIEGMNLNQAKAWASLRFKRSLMQTNQIVWSLIYTGKKPETTETILNPHRRTLSAYAHDVESEATVYAIDKPDFPERKFDKLILTLRKLELSATGSRFNNNDIKKLIDEVLKHMRRLEEVTWNLTSEILKPRALYHFINKIR